MSWSAGTEAEDLRENEAVLASMFAHWAVFCQGLWCVSLLEAANSYDSYAPGSLNVTL